MYSMKLRAHRPIESCDWHIEIAASRYYKKPLIPAVSGFLLTHRAIIGGVTKEFYMARIFVGECTETEIIENAQT